MASCFGPEGQGLIPDAAKDIPSACGVVLKVPWLIASSLPCVFSGKTIPSLSETYQNCGSGRWMVLPSVVVRQKSESCYCNNNPPISGVTYPHCFKPFTGLGSEVVHVNNSKQTIPFKHTEVH